MKPTGGRLSARCWQSTLPTGRADAGPSNYVERDGSKCTTYSATTTPVFRVCIPRHVRCASSPNGGIKARAVLPRRRSEDCTVASARRRRRCIIPDSRRSQSRYRPWRWNRGTVWFPRWYSCTERFRPPKSHRDRWRDRASTAGTGGFRPCTHIGSIVATAGEGCDSLCRSLLEYLVQPGIRLTFHGAIGEEAARLFSGEPRLIEMIELDALFTASSTASKSGKEAFTPM